MAITLKNILKDIKPLSIQGSPDTEISQVCFDSRKVTNNSLFVAVKGTTSDGHQFISDTIDKGATAIICENLPENRMDGITYIKVKDSHSALGIAASNFFDNPSSKLKLVGVTGTNGKTSIVTLHYQLFTALGYKCGLLSTIKNLIVEKEIGATHTTPDPVQLNSLMKEMVDYGCEYCFMEVSSHAAHQKRIAGLTFTGGIFTNLTRDHLDYHGTLKDYLEAKKSFFDSLLPSAYALVNMDDKNGRVMIQNCKAKKAGYGLKTLTDFKCNIIEKTIQGMLVRFNRKDLWLRLTGEFNAYNMLSVYASAILLGQENEQVLQIISNLKPVRGRFELVYGKNNITGIVDYAHTPDALENVLNSIVQLRKEGQKIITVVGAGGNRDKGKRPMMAKIAATLSDKTILTSDNPRNEDPEQIIKDMAEGISPEQSKNVLQITNRRDAIKTACMLAEQNDIILVAGKGHEDYQEVKGVKSHFDDVEVLNEFINN
jgi:UDP-N-acetylmuramoyl-L-alanyl-D-glutamate--2,6-diaminopimelate ligase